jgi:hypothetical protein
VGTRPRSRTFRLSPFPQVLLAHLADEGRSPGLLVVMETADVVVDAMLNSTLPLPATRAPAVGIVVDHVKICEQKKLVAAMGPKIEFAIVAQIGPDISLGASIRVPIDDMGGRLAIGPPRGDGGGHCDGG